MPLPLLIPIAAAAAKVSVPLVLKVAGGVVVGKTIHEMGKEKGKYEGEKEGREKQAETDAEKFKKQERDFRKQADKFEKDKRELEEILARYEKIIEELLKKFEEHDPTDEERNELEELLKKYAAKSAEYNREYGDPAQGLATAAVYHYFSKDDDKIQEDIPLDSLGLPEAITSEVEKIFATYPFLFSNVQEYLDELSDESIKEIMCLVDQLISCGKGMIPAKEYKKEMFDKYLAERDINGKADTSVANYATKQKREKEAAFKMPVEGVFAIKNRGVVVTGIVSCGSVRLGDIVTIQKKNGKNLQAWITGIEIDHRLYDKAERGDNVGILLKNGALAVDVEPNDVLLKF